MERAISAFIRKVNLSTQKQAKFDTFSLLTKQYNLNHPVIATLHRALNLPRRQGVVVLFQVLQKLELCGVSQEGSLEHTQVQF